MTPTTNKPRRIQRKRTKGWRMPPNTVYVGRPSKWGNPYSLVYAERLKRETDLYGDDDTAAEIAVTLFEQKMAYTHDEQLEKFLAPLRGKNLACFCPLDQPCHADVLLELANK